MSDEQSWPGVKPAQAFVLPSYQWMIARLEAADSRIHTMGAFIATVSLAMPTLVTALKLDVSFTSLWFRLAMCVGLVAVLIGAVVRARGKIRLLHPMVLYEKWMGKPEWQFQKDVLYFAGKHFEDNKTNLDGKANALLWMTLLFVVELGLLLLWIGSR